MRIRSNIVKIVFDLFYQRARDLFYALWVCDLFMKRVESKGTWSLMCPHECPGLSDVYGEEFEKLYTSYENEKKFRKQIPAQKLWYAILESQIETGTPYMLYKDACNKKSNQKVSLVVYNTSDQIFLVNILIVLKNFIITNHSFCISPI